MEYFCVRLPYLRPAGREAMPFARFLSPGLECCQTDEFFAPVDYPWPAATAEAFLADLRRLDYRDLQAMRLEQGNIRSEIWRRDEMTDLARFAGAKPGATALDLAREQAQKALLWRWLLEESQAEIDSLEKACLASETGLLQCVLDHEETQALAEPCGSGDEYPWQSVAANAAFFLPPDLPVLSEGAMRSDLLDRLDFEETAAYAAKGAACLMKAVAPLWQALGQSAACGELGAMFNAPRVWLALK